MLDQEKIRLQTLSNEENRLEAQNNIESLEGRILDINLAQVQAKKELNDEENKGNKQLREAFKSLQMIRRQRQGMGATRTTVEQEIAAQQRIMTLAKNTDINLNALSRTFNLPMFQGGGMVGIQGGIVEPGEAVLKPVGISNIIDLFNARKNIVADSTKKDYISNVEINFNVAGNMDQKTFQKIKQELPNLLNSTLKRNGGVGYKKLIQGNRG
jgi:hypothetical protein